MESIRLGEKDMRETIPKRSSKNSNYCWLYTERIHRKEKTEMNRRLHYFFIKDYIVNFLPKRIKLHRPVDFF